MKRLPRRNAKRTGVLMGGVAVLVTALMILGLASISNQAHAVENSPNGEWEREYGVSYPGPDGIPKDTVICKEWKDSAELATDDVVLAAVSCGLLIPKYNAPGAIVCVSYLVKEGGEALYETAQQEKWCNGGTTSNPNGGTTSNPQTPVQDHTKEVPGAQKDYKTPEGTDYDNLPEETVTVGEGTAYYESGSYTDQDGNQVYVYTNFDDESDVYYVVYDKDTGDSYNTDNPPDQCDEDDKDDKDDQCDEDDEDDEDAGDTESGQPHDPWGGDEEPEVRYMMEELDLASLIPESLKTQIIEDLMLEALEEQARRENEGDPVEGFEYSRDATPSEIELLKGILDHNGCADWVDGSPPVVAQITVTPGEYVRAVMMLETRGGCAGPIMGDGNEGNPPRSNGGTLTPASKTGEPGVPAQNQNQNMKQTQSKKR